MTTGFRRWFALWLEAAVPGLPQKGHRKIKGALKSPPSAPHAAAFSERASWIPVSFSCSFLLYLLWNLCTRFSSVNKNSPVFCSQSSFWCRICSQLEISCRICSQTKIWCSRKRIVHRRKSGAAENGLFTDENLVQQKKGLLLEAESHESTRLAGNFPLETAVSCTVAPQQTEACYQKLTVRRHNFVALPSLFC